MARAQTAIITLLVGFCCTSSAFPAVPLVTDHPACIELNGPGIPKAKLNMRLVTAALDESRLGKPELRYYKSVASVTTGETFHVFSLVRWSDIYRVYVADRTQSKLLRKFAYGSFHYPCSKPPAT